jgi:putative DNA methylase
MATQKMEEGVFNKDDVLSLPSPETRERAGGDGGKKRTIKVSVFEIRQLLAKPEQVNAFLAEYAPPVLDPFCGGGSIPLEAQRLGLRTYASDLNPVPVLITKALIEIPPKFAGRPPVNPEWQRKSREEKAAIAWQGAAGLAEDVRYYGQWMRDEAEKRIGHLYPKVNPNVA